MANQAPIKVSGETKERIRYLAALTDATQAQVVDRAAIAAHLLDVPAEDIQRIAGQHPRH
jgi:predicted DNA-binding protein